MARAVLLATTAGLRVLLLAAAACGGDDGEEATPSVDAAVDRSTAQPDVQLDVTPAIDAGADVALPVGDAACGAVVGLFPNQPANHVDAGEPVTYLTNPPSGGPHYPVWANFVEYDHPVADGYLVHSLEHGAVVLSYDCDESACVAPPGVLDGLRAVRNAVPSDPLCDPSIRVRIILAPRPANDVPVAAAAWGATYKADCVDGPSLLQFISDHYAKTAENFCAPGQTF
jgi:hypothetical protein